MLKIQRVASNHVVETLPFVAGYILDALRHDTGEATIETINHALVTGSLDLWLIFESESKGLRGCATTGIIFYPMKRTLEIHTVTVDAPRDEWFPLIDTLERYAEGYGCTDIVILGRRGLAKILPEIGFKQVQVKMSKQVTYVQ